MSEEKYLTPGAHMHSRFVDLRLESAVAGCGVDVHGRMEIMYRHEMEREEQEEEEKQQSMGNHHRTRNAKHGKRQQAMEQESRRKKISRRYEPKVMGNKQSQILGIRDRRDCGPGRCVCPVCP